MSKFIPRMFVCFVLALSALALVAWISPQQGPVVVYKLTLVLLAGYLGYWLDRWVFPYARPEGYLKREWRSHGVFWPDDQADFEVVSGHMQAFAASMIRRALIIAGAMLAVGLGL